MTSLKPRRPMAAKRIVLLLILSLASVAAFPGARAAGLDSWPGESVLGADFLSVDHDALCNQSRKQAISYERNIDFQIFLGAETVRRTRN